MHSAFIERNSKLLSLLPREARLLFLCSAGETAADEIRSLVREGVSWDTVCRLAQREGAEPMTWAAVERHSGLSASDSSVAGLRRLARVSAFKMKYLHQRLGQSVRALDDAGIDCTLLKGAALATSVYSSVGQRPMIDIDLLVSRERAGDALTVLLENGWAWQAGKDRDRPIDFLHHLPALLDSRGMEISLELHTSLFPPGSPFRFAPDTILEMATPAASGAGLIPHPIHMLLHTCTHLAWSHQLRKHACRAFRDVAAILAKFSIDWSEFIATARNAKAQTCCYWTFRLARSLVGVAVPEEVLDALAPPLPSALLACLERHFALILLPTPADCPSIRLRRLMWSAGILPGWSEHAASRPWIVLKLTPEGLRARGLVSTTRGSHSVADAGGAWMNYCRSLVLGESRPNTMSV